MKFERHIYHQRDAVYPGTNPYTYAWQKGARVIDVPEWPNVKRFGAALEGVSALHHGVTWEGLQFRDSKKAAVATVDLGDRPLGFCLHEDEKTLAFEVPLLRPFVMGHDYHSVFIFSTLQRRHKLLTYAFATKRQDSHPIWIEFVVCYNEVSLEEVLANFTDFFAELTRQITATLEDLKKYDKAQKRREKKDRRKLLESTERMTRIREGRVRQPEPWINDEAYQRNLYNFGYALLEPDYEKLGISEADTEKYLVVRNNAWQKTLFVQKLGNNRDLMVSVYRQVRDIFSDMGRYTVTVLYGRSWAEIVQAHPEYADGELEGQTLETYPAVIND